MRARNGTMAAVMAGALLLGGCAAMPPPLDPAQAAASAYRVGAGDRLRITVFNEPSLTGEYGVTPGGVVAFPLIGDVPAQDSTVETIQRAITARLAAGYVNDPRVSAEILAFRPYYILGEVNRPGAYPFSAGLTVAQAVAVAGGYTYRANRRTLFLSRDRARERSVDLRGPVVSVLPGDTIRVGERYF